MRQAGKISIPEESFDRIREARELHKEGLGTESVRRRLREGNDLDVEELTERLDRLSETLESMQGDLKPADGASSSQTLQTVLARQDLLISRVSRLTERVEDLLKADGRPLKAASSYQEEIREQKTFLEQLERRLEMAKTGLATDDPPVTEAFSEPIMSLMAPTWRERLGALVHRWRGVLTLLLGLLVVTVLMWSALTLSGGKDAEQSIPAEQGEEESQSVPAADPGPQAVEVPDLVGLPLLEAEDKLAQTGLETGARSEMPSSAIPVGNVAAQGLQAGAEVDAGTRVDIVVSDGPPIYPPQGTGINTGAGVDGTQYAPDGAVQYRSGESNLGSL